LKELEKRPKFPKLKAWQAGVILGLVAALAQAVYNVLPTAIKEFPAYRAAPIVYGFCMFCHVRDFVNWFLKDSIPWMKVAPIAVIVPVLSAVGLLVGGSLTALAAKEFRFRTTYNLGLGLIYGFLVAASAAVLGACSTRVLLRVAYFDGVAVFGLIFLILGVFVATEFILKRGGG